MKIVAFLLSPSKGVELDEDRYLLDQPYHQEMLLKSMTGKRLKVAFGYLFDEIWWDNANPRIGETQCDIEHMIKVLASQSPGLVLSFGKEPELGVLAIDMRPITHMVCHHPNARFKNQDDLNAFAHRVRCYLHEQDLIAKGLHPDMLRIKNWEKERPIPVCKAIT